MIHGFRNIIVQSKVNLSILCITLFLATTPFAHNICKWILYISIPIFIYNRNLFKVDIKKNIVFWTWVIFYLFMCIHSIAITPGVDWNNLMMTRISIILMPILFAFMIIDKQNYKLIFTAYTLACTAIVILLFCIGLYRYLTYLPLYNHHYLMYELLSEPLMHPGLLSNYIFFAMIIVVEQLLFNQDFLFVSNKWLKFSLILFIIFLGALTSKNIFIVMLLYVLLMTYRILKSNMSSNYKRKLILYILSLIPIFLIMVRLLIWARFSSILDELSNIGKDVKFANSTGSRLSALLVGIDLVKENPFSGYGTANGNNILLKALEAQGYADLVKWKMHTHNQYLKYALEYGMIGLFIFLTALFSSFFKALRPKQYLSITLILMLIIHCFTDDVLDVQYGILFFLPWLSILIINDSFRRAYATE